MSTGSADPRSAAPAAAAGCGACGGSASPWLPPNLRKPPPPSPTDKNWVWLPPALLNPYSSEFPPLPSRKSPSQNPQTPASSLRDWARLPRDLLISIAARMSASDLARLRSVCSSWSSAAAGPLPSSPHFPWLAFLPPGSPAGRLSFFSPQDSRLYSAPALPPPKFRCVGSRDGWIVTLDLSLGLQLLNPLTGDKVPLPSLYTIPDVHLYGNHRRIVFDGWCFRRVVLSSAPPAGGGDFTAVAVYKTKGYGDGLAFAKRGDAAWTALEVATIDEWYMDYHTVEGLQDVVYHDGKLFAVSDRCFKFQAFDLSGPSPRTFTFLDKPVPRVCFCLGCAENRNREPPRPCRYLVSTSAGDLLQVVIKRKAFEELTADDFEISRFNPGLESCWEAIGDLGDLSVFIDGKHSMSLAERDVPGLKANCIYWAREGSDSERRYFSEVGVLDIEKGSFEPCFHLRPQLYCMKMMYPVWFMPSLS